MDVYIPRSFKGLLVVFLLTLVLQSCSTSKQYVNVPYFKDLPDSSREVVQNAFHSAFKIQPNDQLNIVIQTPVAMASEMTTRLANSQLTVPVLNSSYGSGGQNAASPLGGYIVDSDGYIYIADTVVGKIKVAGLTTTQARDLIIAKLKNPVYGYKGGVSVSVSIANQRFSVIGEVNRPGMYMMPSDKVSVLDALAQAGDLTIYGRRDNITLVRDSAGHSVYTRFSLNSKNIASQSIYFMRPNDVLYIEPNKAKAKSANVDVATLQYLSLGTSIASLLVVIVTQLTK